MFETLKKMMVEELQLKADDITRESELSGDLGINSIELADLVMLCEDKFGIEFDEDSLHGFITVGDVADYLEKNVPADEKNN